MRSSMPMPIRPLSALTAALLAAACTGMPAGEDRLATRPPVSAAAATLATDAGPAEVAQALRDRGFSDVALLRDGSVRLRSSSPALVDCGTVVQVAMGNRAEFPGTAAKAVLIANRPPGDPLVRRVETRSEIRLRPLSSGGGYAVEESHRVKLSYQSVKTGRKSVSSAAFGTGDSARLADNTTCRSSGLIATILG